MRVTGTVLFASLLPVAGACTTPPVCVHTPAEFQAALDATVGSSTFVEIRVARGIYDLGGSQLSFVALQAGQGQLDVTGGYEATCTTQVRNPALTVLDAHGSSSVLSLSSAGGISVRYLTVQNGSPSGLSVNSQTQTIVNYNIIRDNSGGAYTSGVGLAAGVNAGSGIVEVDGNLIVGNSASDPNPYRAAGSVYNSGSGDVYVTNDTVADNTVTSMAFCGGLDISASSGTAYVSNGIFWHNSNCGLTVDGAVLTSNDYGSLSGSAGPGSSGNLDVAPKFVDGYALAADSPLLGQGAIAPPGGLPSIDIVGNPRSYGGSVDIGAYERGDYIYADDFDH